MQARAPARLSRLPRVLRDGADRRFVPPGGTAYFQLADVLVQGQDIRRPLGTGEGVALLAQRLPD